MALVTVIGFHTCYLGLRRGVETVTKVMMSGLFVLLIVLAARSATMPGASAGISFYLNPDFSKLTENGLWTSVYAALGQAFFTLSVGIGSMAMFGSYIDKRYSLTTESVTVMCLDLFAALTTVIAVFENIVAFGIDVMHFSRKKSVIINCVLMLILAAPCTLSFSLLSGFRPFGPGSGMLDLEDFVLSNNVLPVIIIAIFVQGYREKFFS